MYRYIYIYIYICHLLLDVLGHDLELTGDLGLEVVHPAGHLYFTANFQTKNLEFWNLSQTNSYIKEVGFLSAPSNFLAGHLLCYVILRPVHLLRVSLLRVLESNFPGDSLSNSLDMRIPTP